MKLYSHAVLIVALAGPALCQVPDAAMAAQGRAMAAQGRAMADAQALSADKMEALQEKLAEQADRVRDVLRPDKMAEIEDRIADAQWRIESNDFALSDTIQDKLAEASEKFSSIDMSDLEAKIATAQDNIFVMPDIDIKLGQMQFELDSNKFTDMADKFTNEFNLAFLQEGKPFPAQPAGPMGPMGPKARIISLGRGEGEYDAGTRALDQHHYDEAVLHFDQIINSKSSRADGALYWKAYALNRAGKRDDALAAIATLRRDYATSAWLNDAGALEAEVKQGSGQPVSPAQESNDDLKLLAINSLMSADSDRAIPLIEGILKGNSPPRIKQNAMFVLSQSKSPKAQQMLGDIAKGGGNPDLQLQAIQILGQSGTREVQQQLNGIYGTVADTRVKSTIIDSLSNSRSYDALLNIAKTEKDTNLRNKAIRGLANSRNSPVDGLLELYPGADSSGKGAIIDGLQSRRDVKTMIDLARKETDLQMKRKIVERIGGMHDNKDAMDFMMEILKQ